MPAGARAVTVVPDNGSSKWNSPDRFVRTESPVLDTIHTPGVLAPLIVTQPLTSNSSSGSSSHAWFSVGVHTQADVAAADDRTANRPTSRAPRPVQ